DQVPVKAKAAKKEPPPRDDTFAEDESSATSNTAPPQDRTEAFDMNAPVNSPESGAETELMDDGAAAPKKPDLDRTAAMDEKAHERAKVHEQAAANKPAATMMGDYKLLKKLGQGGMGAVYKAHQVSLDRDVAVKVLSKELAGKSSFVQRFKREAQVMAKMDHP